MMTTPLPSDAKRRKIHSLGPGTLVFGSVGTQLDMSCQITEIKFSAEAETEDPENVLCGDVVAGARSYSWTMSGSTFQDIEADGVIDWTWKNKGVEVPFKFVPDATASVTVTGRVMVDPIEYGGTVKTKNKSEFEWSMVGDPNFNTSADAGTRST